MTSIRPENVVVSGLRRLLPSAVNTKRHQRQGLGALVNLVITILAYCVVSILLVFANKYIVDVLPASENSGDVTLLVTWVQCVVAATGSSLKDIIRVGRRLLTIGRRRSCVSDGRHSLVGDCVRPAVVCNSLAFVGMLAFNNLCLRAVSVAFYQVARSLTLVFVVILQTVILHQPTSRHVLASCFVMTVGFVLGTQQERQLTAADFSVHGSVFGVAASFFVGLNAIFTKRALDDLSGDSARQTRCCNVNAVLLFLPLLFVTDQLPGQATTINVLTLNLFWAFALLTGALSFAIGWISANQISLTSPLTHHIVTNAKTAVQTLIAVYWDSQSKSLLWFLGVAMVIGGALAYAVSRLREERQSQASLLPIKTSRQNSANDRKALSVVLANDRSAA